MTSQIVKTCGYIVAIIALFVTCCHGISTPLQNFEYDTIIVGMGAAGTTAANTLLLAGKKVLALEAQDRVGGRVWTREFGDGVVEVGAEWIHGQFPSRVYDAAVTHNVSTAAQLIEYVLLRSNGEQADQAAVELLELGRELAEETDVEKPEPVGDVVTRKLLKYIKEKKPEFLSNIVLQQEVFRLLNRMTSGNEAANDWNDVNADSDYEDPEGYRLTSWHRHGYKTFFDIMLNKFNNGTGFPSLDLKLNTEVTEIQLPTDPQEKVTVKTKDGTIFTADYVIVTVSLGVLKERHTTLFKPTLPKDKETAIEKLTMGVLGKIILSFDQVWWPNRKIMYGFLWKLEDLENIKPEDKWTTDILGMSFPMGSSNTVTLWVAGNSVKQMENLPDEEVKSKTMTLLRTFFGNNTIIPEPTGMIKSKWYSNPYTRGTYTFDSMQASTLPEGRSILAAPLKDSTGRDRVLFAGEATHSVRYGTVHGAADTGYREAVKILGN